MLLKREFTDTGQLRTHVDANEDELTLLYEYFDHGLLSLVQNNPHLSLKARKFILQQVGQAVECLHAKNWIHLGWLQEIKYHSTKSALTTILARHQA
jgi:serine/threonine protein kinase